MLADDDFEKGADERGGALDLLVDGGDAGAHAGSLMPKGRRGPQARSATEAWTHTRLAWVAGA
jgi:hypothetical protein